MLTFDVLVERAKRLQTYGPVSSSNAASNRPLVIDSPICPNDKHWLIPIITGQFLTSYGAGHLPFAGLYLIDSRVVAPIANFNPPSRIIGDTVATFSLIDRMFPLRETLNEVAVTPDGTHAKGIISAGNGLADPIEVFEGWYLRMILDGLGVAAGTSVPPFPSIDTIMQLTYQIVEEPTRAGSTTSADPDCQ